MHLFVSEIGFWIQNPPFAASLIVKKEVWAYKAVVSGQITLLTTNRVGRERELSTFQFNKELFRDSFLKGVDSSENNPVIH